MYAKVKLICKKCSCAMEFTTRHPFVSSVVCQNCGQTLESKDHELLSEAMSAICNLPSETEIEPGVIYSDRGFKIALTVTPSYCDPDECYSSDEED